MVARSATSSGKQELHAATLSVSRCHSNGVSLHFWIVLPMLLFLNKNSRQKKSNIFIIVSVLISARDPECRESKGRCLYI
jgi:hypothetical protein